MKARRKEIVDVIRWYKLGDHPNVIKIPDKYKYYIPVIAGATGLLKLNGNDQTKYNEYFIYSGDYIINDVDVMRPEEFKFVYEIIK